MHSMRRTLLRSVVLAVILVLLPVLAFAATTGSVNCGSLNMRSSNSKNSKCVTTLSKGDKVTITGTKGDWYKVTYGKKTGYVLKKYISTGKAASNTKSSKTDSTKSASGTVYVNCSSLAMRSGPGKSNKSVLTLHKGDKLTITGTNGDWYRVKYNKKTGFVMKKYVTKKAPKESVTSKGSGSSGGLKTERLNWFSNVYKIPKRSVFWVKDCKTGKTFQVKRWSGGNHIDAEPYTKKDTQTIRSIYGGFSWRRRSILVKYNGHVYAASMNFFPHGTQTIYNNGFDGHFCIHFYGSKTHGTKRVDSEHQNAVARAMHYSW